MLQRPHKSLAKKFLVIFLAFLIIVGVFLVLKIRQAEKNQHKFTDSVNYEGRTDEQDLQKPLPQNFSTQVPFTPQAPTTNWDELHNEACEEASAIMVNAFFNNSSFKVPASLLLDPRDVETQIDSLTKWQKRNFGYYLSITTKETAEMIEANYNLTTEIAPLNETVIKQALVDGKLVIIPADGRLLKNPHFKSPGPPYHMLVITGFNENVFITNDPGTKHGLNYEYSYETLRAATGNWVHSENEVDLTQKQILIVSKN
jgi:hypothetical protein